MEGGEIGGVIKCEGGVERGKRGRLRWAFHIYVDIGARDGGVGEGGKV
jgi:hypothetical protein